MNRFEVSGFRCSGKTTNAIAVALAFVRCGKKVDYLVHHPSMVSRIKDTIKNKWKTSYSPVNVYYFGSYTHNSNIDVVICDECAYRPPYGVNSRKLIVVEYSTPREIEKLISDNPEFTKAYINEIGFGNTKENTKPQNEMVQHIKDIMVALDCSVTVALEVIKAEKELQ